MNDSLQLKTETFQSNQMFDKEKKVFQRDEEFQRKDKKKVKIILTVILMTIFFTPSCISQKAGFTKPLNQPKLVKLWETDTVLNDIESAIYDKKNKVIYVTNIHGHWLKPNGKGFISKIDTNGAILKHKWVQDIDGPTGTTLYKDKLFVADFNTIIEIDRNTSKIIKKHKVARVERINDLTSSEDGTIYGSGTKSGKLFSLKDGKVTILKTDLNWPNGLLYEDHTILIGLGDKTISKYNLKDKTTKTFVREISNPDGIVAIGNGDYLISSWEGKIHYVSKNGDKKLLLDTTKEKANAADITYIPELKMVLVPVMLQHKLVAYKLVEEN
ncbi:SMP-30/gluconolactonase/LRE family protein [Aquimarina rhabdastrellae]